MASRATYDGPKMFYPLATDIVARVAFGATGAPTLLGPQSRGVMTVTRNSTGNFTFAFGTKNGSVLKPDVYVGLANLEVQPDVSCTQNVATAAVGIPAIWRDDLLTDANGFINAPVQAALATAGGGSLGAATYYYVVTALDSKGNETLKSNERNIATGASGKNTVSWAAVPGATGYRVYRGTATGVENVVYAVAGGSTISFADTGAASQASASVVPAIQARPPVAASSATLQLVNNAGAAVDPAQGEILRFTFTMLDSTAG